MDLADWRSRINDLDNQILNLLNQRAEAALQIGHLKRRHGTPSYVPERGAEILRSMFAPIRGELYLEIAQYLLSRASDLSEVKRVLSHPQGLAQCRAWLSANLPGVATEETTSTAAAAEMAASDPTVAAIASDLAGTLYGVPTLRPHIEDNRHNATRFLVIGSAAGSRPRSRAHRRGTKS